MVLRHDSDDVGFIPSQMSQQTWGLAQSLRFLKQRKPRFPRGLGDPQPESCLALARRPRKSPTACGGASLLAGT